MRIKLFTGIEGGRGRGEGQTDEGKSRDGGGLREAERQGIARDAAKTKRKQKRLATKVGASPTLENMSNSSQSLIIFRCCSWW